MEEFELNKNEVKVKPLIYAFKLHVDTYVGQHLTNSKYTLANLIIILKHLQPHYKLVRRVGMSLSYPAQIIKSLG
jgi:hypothetical protein